MARQAKSIQVKEAILQCAVELFAARGWEQTTLQDVADCLGITRGPIYYYFNDKLDLYEAALILQMERYEKRCLHILTDDTDFFVRIEILLQDWIEKRLTEGYDRDVVSIPALQSVRKHYTFAVEKVYDFIVRRAREEVCAGTLRADADPVDIAEVVMLYISGLVRMVHSPLQSQTKENPRRAISRLVNMLKRQYATKETLA